MFCKLVSNNYIEAIGRGGFGIEITETEYNEILNLILNKPKAESGYDYRLKTDLTWELYELPPMPIEDEEATAEDYEAALTEVGV